MPSASIVTIQNDTRIKVVRLPTGHSTDEVDRIAQVLSSIIEEDRNILKVVVDYEGCNNTDVITHYDP